IIVKYEEILQIGATMEAFAVADKCICNWLGVFTCSTKVKLVIPSGRNRIHPAQNIKLLIYRTSQN
ncbi:MAG: hypothetical protein IIV73_00325, partial [Bacteroidaceae bacterium]|nr:hypothetical protein [Bacteroidaceae bacterium]